MQIKDILEMTRTRMNSNEVYTEAIYSDGCYGIVQKLIEIELKRTLQLVKPKWNVYHPADNTGKPDICFGNHGVEIKTTKGWVQKYFRKRKNEFVYCNCVMWTSRYKKPTDKKIPFLFIKFSIVNNELIFDEVYFGLVALTDWTVVKVKGVETELRIGLPKVKAICKKII